MMVVVLKALNTQLQGTPDYDLELMLVDNFDKEAAILESILHPNISALLDCGEDFDVDERAVHFIVLEYMQGGDLLRFTRNQAPGLQGMALTLSRDLMRSANSNEKHSQCRPSFTFAEVLIIIRFIFQSPLN
jgi:serine/threonine protein kinase